MEGNKPHSTARLCGCAQATLQSITHIYICRCCNASMEGLKVEPLHLSSEGPAAKLLLTSISMQMLCAVDKPLNRLRIRGAPDTDPNGQMRALCLVYCIHMAPFAIDRQGKGRASSMTILVMAVTCLIPFRALTSLPSRRMQKDRGRHRCPSNHIGGIASLEYGACPPGLAPQRGSHITKDDRLLFVVDVLDARSLVALLGRSQGKSAAGIDWIIVSFRTQANHIRHSTAGERPAL